MIFILLVVIIISHYYPRMSSISLIFDTLDFSIFGFQGTTLRINECISYACIRKCIYFRLSSVPAHD